MEVKSEFVGIVSYMFISLLLGAIGFSASLSLWQAGQGGNAFTVGLLVCLQIGLFWLNLLPQRGRCLWLCYYGAQTALVLLISLLLYWAKAGEVSYVGSAALCLIGEALGLWGNSRTALRIGLFYFALALLLLALMLDRERFVVALVNMVVNGSFIMLLLFFFNQQLAEREKVQELAESLESANAQLVASAARIEALTRQSERQRMARELHDTLAQGLAGLVLQLEAAKAHLGAARNERAAAIIEQAIARARSTLAESRAAIDDLRLTQLGLEARVREQAERFSQQTGLPCRLDLAMEPQQLRQEVANHVVSIVSEALTNIARHAQATQVVLRCVLAHDALDLEIGDNGLGFDPTATHATGHYGLLGMRERARLAGGTLTIEASPGQGSKISFRLNTTVASVSDKRFRTTTKATK